MWVEQSCELAKYGVVSSLLQRTARKRSRSYWTVDSEAGRLLLSGRTIVVRQSLAKWKAKWFVDCVCWFVVVVSSEELSRGTPSTVSSWVVVRLSAVVCVLRRFSPSAVSTQGVVDREYSAVRRRQPCWAEILVVDSRVGARAVRHPSSGRQVVACRQSSGAKSLVRRQAVSLLVIVRRRQPTWCRHDAVVFRRALWSTVSRFQPALVVSRYPKSSVLSSDAVVNGQFSRVVWLVSWTVATQRRVRPSSGTSVLFTVAWEHFSVIRH